MRKHPLRRSMHPIGTDGNDAPVLLAHQALLGERLLVRDKTAYVRFFVRIMGQVEDERYWLNIHHQARLKRLREGRFGRPQRL